MSDVLEIHKLRKEQGVSYILSCRELLPWFKARIERYAEIDHLYLCDEYRKWNGVKAAVVDIDGELKFVEANHLTIPQPFRFDQ